MNEWSPIDAFGLLLDFDWRAYQERNWVEVKKLDALIQKTLDASIHKGIKR